MRRAPNPDPVPPPKGVKHQETLKTRAGVSHTSDLVEDLVDEFLSDSVVASGIIVGSILLASDHLLWME